VTSTAARESADPGVAGPGRRDRWQARWHGFSPRRRWVVGVAGGLLALAVVTGGVYVWWLGGGLISVSSTVQDRADIAQRQLKKFEKSLTAGDRVAARRHLRKAEQALSEARGATDKPQVRIAKWLPYTRNTVTDLDHLLSAATVLVGSANDAMGLYASVSGDGSTLFKDGQVDLDELASARDALLGMSAALDKAESELEQVDGDGPLGDEALAKKKSALKQIRSVQRRIAPFTPVIDALPAAVGAEGTKRYLVAIMNPAEMRASGGAPLSMALVVFKKGKLTIPLKGTTSSVTKGSPEGLLGDSPQLVWPRVKTDPFQPAVGEPQRFVNAGFNPDFRVSGEQMMRATPKFFGHKTDGVIALDVVALSHLLDAVGPVESEYGVLTPENLVDELLVKAYVEQGADVLGRQARNDALMTTILTDITAGGGIRTKVTALAKAIPNRHLQFFFRDKRLQRVAEEMDAAGAVPSPKVGNLTAVYTQNGNGSKVDVFQDREIDETVQLRKDGSALVRRTVTLKNNTPPYVGDVPDARRGYLTRWVTNLVINLMPPGARITDEPEVELEVTQKKGVDQAGRTFAQAAVVTSPGGSSTLSWEYVVPRAAYRTGASLRYVDSVVTQNTVKGFLLRTTVLAPEGWTLRRVDDSQAWFLQGAQGFLQIGVSGPLKLQLMADPA
jgi:hypothetical protein